MRTNPRGLMSTNPNQWFADARVNIPGKIEVLYEPLFDTLEYPAAGAAEIRFFQDSNKTSAETNMELDGSIPKGKAFKITGIQLHFYPGVDLNVSDAITDPEFSLVDDVRTFAENGFLELNLNSKNYCRQAPLGVFPPVERLLVETAGTGNNPNNIATQYATTAGREFSIVPKLIESNTFFEVKIRELPPLPSGVNGKIVCTLNGYVARNAQ